MFGMVITKSPSCFNKSASCFFLKHSLETSNEPAIHLSAEEIEVISLVEFSDRKNNETGNAELGCKENNNFCTLANSPKLSR